MPSNGTIAPFEIYRDTRAIAIQRLRNDGHAEVKLYAHVGAGVQK